MGSWLTNLLSILDRVLYEVVYRMIIPHGNPNDELDSLTIKVMNNLKTYQKLNLSTRFFQNILSISKIPSSPLIYGQFLPMFFIVK
jgi:hypothetical protein